MVSEFFFHNLSIFPLHFSRAAVTYLIQQCRGSKKQSDQCLSPFVNLNMQLQCPRITQSHFKSANIASWNSL